MRIGLNMTFLVEGSGGSGTYARELSAALRTVAPGASIHAWVGSTAPRAPWMADSLDEVIRLPVAGVGGVAHFAWDLAGMIAQARARKLDVLHGLAYVVAPVHPGIATVVTQLDTIWKRVPDAMPLPGRIVNRTLGPLLGRTSNRVIAISHAGKADLVADLRVPASRIDVVPLGIRPVARGRPDDGLRARLGLGPEPIVLCVAQKRRHKNLETLVRAFAAVAPESQLVLPGAPNAYEDELRALAACEGVAHRVRFLGWVPDDDLEALYGLAAAFVLPSLIEGFGLPLLEAMARDVPVACSNVSALPEVVGDAALLFDPLDAAQIAAALTRLLSDAGLRDDLVARGRERVAAHTWEATARGTLAVYERAISVRGHG